MSKDVIFEIYIGKPTVPRVQYIGSKNELKQPKKKSIKTKGKNQ